MKLAFSLGPHVLGDENRTAHNDYDDTDIDVETVGPAATAPASRAIEAAISRVCELVIDVPFIYLGELRSDLSPLRLVQRQAS